MLLSNNSQAISLFMLIIRAHTAFSLKKENLKDIETEKNNTDFVKSLIHDFEEDLFSSDSREFGVTSGVSSSDILKFESKIDKANNKKRILENEKLISLEKHFKKLKHKFREDYPELNIDMISMLTDHISHLNKERYLIKKNNDQIIKLSSRFKSFLHKSFYGNKNSESISACSLFIKNMIEKYEIKINPTEMIQINKSKNDKLNIQDIKTISQLIEKIIISLKDSDLLDVKGVYAKDVIDNILKFKNLIIEYNKIQTNFNNTL